MTDTLKQRNNFFSQSSFMTALILLSTSLFLFSSCAKPPRKKTAYKPAKPATEKQYPTARSGAPYTPISPSSLRPVNLRGQRLEGVWENLNTHSLHAIKKLKKGGYKITAIYKQKSKNYDEHKIIFTRWKGGVLQWQYLYRPTGWYVTYTTERINKDVLWCIVQNRQIKRKSTKFVRMMSLVDKEVQKDLSNNKKLKKKIRKKVIGKIYRINGSEIIVASGKIGRDLKMYQKVFAIVKGKKIKMKVFFPMQTIAKCRLVKKHRKYLKSLREGMPVYK